MKYVYDKIHGMIALTPLMLSFIDTPEFQRLRQIKQLGSSQFIFPTANHTRFEHSLGVSHLARTVGTHLKLKKKEIELLALAGLLHDIGHGPLSHSFDQFLEENDIFKSEGTLTKHENRSISIIQMMVKKYKIKLSKKDLEYIFKCIQPPPEFRTYAHDIISGEYDMDRFDYILRDSYSTISIRFNLKTVYHIINSSFINEDGRLAYKESNTVQRALQTFKEDRLYMYQNVYNNPKTDRIDKLIKGIMKIAFKNMNISLETFLQFPFLDSFIEFFYAHSEEELKVLINRIYTRQF